MADSDAARSDGVDRVCACVRCGCGCGCGGWVGVSGWVRGWVSEWVRGCVGAWVRGCVGACVCACVQKSVFHANTSAQAQACVCVWLQTGTTAVESDVMISRRACAPAPATARLDRAAPLRR